MVSRNYKAAYKFAFMISMVVILFLPESLYAKDSRGKITGQVMNSNKSVVSGATVRITSLTQGTSTTVTTNKKGFFQALYLLPGFYKVAVEAKGFKKYTQESVEVHVNGSLRLDVTLEVDAMEKAATSFKHH